MTDRDAAAGGADGEPGDDDPPTVELSRRDVTAALTAAGATSVLGGSLAWATLADDGEDTSEGGPEGFSEHERATLVALARTLYPSAVSGVAGFVEQYTVGRVRDRPSYAAGMREAVATLDEYAVDWYDGPYVDLPPAKREDLLEIMGVSGAEPDPEGIDPERVRFYLVNELLFALYTTPTGGELVGIENPQGHPGGTTSYRRGPR